MWWRTLADCLFSVTNWPHNFITSEVFILICIHTVPSYMQTISYKYQNHDFLGIVPAFRNVQYIEHILISFPLLENKWDMYVVSIVQLIILTRFKRYWFCGNHFMQSNHDEIKMFRQYNESELSFHFLNQITTIWINTLATWCKELTH